MIFLLEKIGHFLFQKKFDRHDLENLPRKIGNHCDRALYLWDYQSPNVKKLVRHMKNHRSYFLARHIADFLYTEIIDIISEQRMFSYFREPLVIPIPINKKRMQERGFNQTHIYTKFLSKKLQARYSPDILKRKPSPQKQALVHNKHARFENVKNCFYISQKNLSFVRGKDIIIVDDVMTTGATLNEAEKTLKRAGARNIIAITLAH